MSFDAIKAKRIAPLVFILFAFMGIMCIWMFVGIALPSIADIRHSAPSVRITSGAFWTPTWGLACLSLAAAAIPRFFLATKLAERLEKIALWIVLPAVLLIPVFLIGGSLLQRHYMPHLGYHYCDQLSGNPTVWFNDWVRNPAWCVYGKRHEWVREQAARQSG
jgi:magnesium-transporting ATPase (P-type)